MSVRDICSYIEEFAPLSYQEPWDNCGLILGSPEQPVQQVLLTIDVTEAVVAEAVELQTQMIISHHPVILSGIKRLTGKNDTERAVILAIKHNIAVYAAHTNMDIVSGGVSHKMAQKLNLYNVEVLSPRGVDLSKLVTFIPKDYYPKVSGAVFEAGAGHIGNYDSCGYSVAGEGTFRALGDQVNPFVGKPGEFHTEPEIRFETVFPSYLKHQIIDALLRAHPYEEVAYDIYGLQNENHQAGLGVVGILSSPLSEQHFLDLLKETFLVPVIRHTHLRGREILRVALCGGSGSSLLGDAIRSHADVFVTADFKYHQFAEGEHDILIADMGHFESEQYTKEIFHEILKKKIPNFVVHFSKVKTNPINYI
ncbi:MAG: Nif3-like dinuclear metal center hexameric protein [Bacteroidales bacterium]|nr:Nif3-like dinuclear metal center hexameric protein [Bacteroidales bacterium]